MDGRGDGDYLYGQWGWALKLAGVAFAVGAFALQRRRAKRSDLDRRTSVRTTVVRIGATALTSYVVLYTATKALGYLAS